MMAAIHPTAIVEPGARLGEGVSIGPYSCVGPDVELGRGVVLHAHVVVAGHTRIGEGTTVHPFASLGQPPQDRAYRGEPALLDIGAGNIVREYVTINGGTGAKGTRVGDRCFLMTASHIAHDCQVGNGVVMANQATLGGHVMVQDRAIIGGLAAIHQFTRVGEQAMIGGMSGIAEDVIPFGMAVGNRARLMGLNLVGLKRGGVSRPEIHAMRAAFRHLFDDGVTLAERLEQAAAQYHDNPRVLKIIEFIKAPSKRGLCRPKPAHAG
jgi:UDP-N-acetylglucosamine acyltransferase